MYDQPFLRSWKTQHCSPILSYASQLHHIIPMKGTEKNGRKQWRQPSVYVRIVAYMTVTTDYFYIMYVSQLIIVLTVIIITDLSLVRQCVINAPRTVLIRRNLFGKRKRIYFPSLIIWPLDLFFTNIGCFFYLETA